MVDISTNLTTKNIIIAVIIILIIGICWYVLKKKNNQICDIKGFWESPKDFCNESGLEFMCFLINGKDSYILAYNTDKKPIINTLCTENTGITIIFKKFN